MKTTTTHGKYCSFTVAIGIALVTAVPSFAMGKPKPAAPLTGVCQQDDSVAFRFAINVLALEESQVTPDSWLGPDGTVYSDEDVCRALVAESVAPSQRSGYTDDVLLKFQGESCSISVQITPDGKTGDFTPFSCSKN